MRWPWQRKEESPAAPPVRAPAVANIVLDGTDPAAWNLFGAGEYDPGQWVGEAQALGISAFYRGVSVIASTLGGLLLKSVSEPTPGVVRPVRSIFDNPGGPVGLTPFEWKETVGLHMLLHGDAFLRHRWNNAGALYALDLIPPQTVSVEWGRPAGEVQQNGGLTPPVGGKWFRITYHDGPLAGRQEVIDATELTQVPSLSVDGLRGLSLLGLARRGLSTALHGDKAAGRLFRSGALISGIVTPDGDDLEPNEVPTVKREIVNSATGWENAGGIAVVNRQLKFTPWQLSAVDAQFLQSRQFSIEEISRWTGVPPHLLMQTSKQTSWGSGIAEQNEGLARYTLLPWTSRIEQRCSRLLPAPRRVEFQFDSLKRPAFADDVNLSLAMFNQGAISRDELRMRLGYPPIGGPEGEAFAGAGAAPAPEDEPAPPGPDDDEEEAGEDE